MSSSADEQIAGLKAQVLDMTGQLATMNAEKGAARERLGQARKQVADLQQRLQQAEAELQRRGAEVDEVKCRLKDSQCREEDLQLSLERERARLDLAAQVRAPSAPPPASTPGWSPADVPMDASWMSGQPTPQPPPGFTAEQSPSPAPHSNTPGRSEGPSTPPHAEHSLQRTAQLVREWVESLQTPIGMSQEDNQALAQTVRQRAREYARRLKQGPDSSAEQLLIELLVMNCDSKLAHGGQAEASEDLSARGLAAQPKLPRRRKRVWCCGCFGSLFSHQELDYSDTPRSPPPDEKDGGDKI